MSKMTDELTIFEHKHDWQQTGTVEIPTGKYLYQAQYSFGEVQDVCPITFEALVHICRDCGEIKTTKINELNGVE